MVSSKFDALGGGSTSLFSQCLCGHPHRTAVHHGTPSYWSGVDLDTFLHFGRYKQFKEFQKRILVATDLFGRGIDIERVACRKRAPQKFFLLSWSSSCGTLLFDVFTSKDPSASAKVNIVINYDMPDESDSYLQLGHQGA